MWSAFRSLLIQQYWSFITVYQQHTYLISALQRNVLIRLLATASFHEAVLFTTSSTIKILTDRKNSIPSVKSCKLPSLLNKKRHISVKIRECFLFIVERIEAIRGTPFLLLLRANSLFIKSVCFYIWDFEKHFSFVVLRSAFE